MLQGDHSRRTFDNPLPLADQNAKKLKGLLTRAAAKDRGVRPPFTRAVIFLAEASMTCALDTGSHSGRSLRARVLGTSPGAARSRGDRNGAVERASSSTCTISIRCARCGSRRPEQGYRPVGWNHGGQCSLSLLSMTKHSQGESRHARAGESGHGVGHRGRLALVGSSLLLQTLERQLRVQIELVPQGVIGMHGDQVERFRR